MVEARGQVPGPHRAGSRRTHGASYTTAVGDGIAYIIKARVQLLRDIGAAVSPDTAFSLIQGIETLSLRIERHVAERAGDRGVARRPRGHRLRELRGPPLEPLVRRGEPPTPPRGVGAVVSFELKGGVDAGRKFVESLTLFSHLANIGDVRSLVIHPASTTHSQLTPGAAAHDRRHAGPGAPVGRPGAHRRPEGGPPVRPDRRSHAPRHRLTRCVHVIRRSAARSVPDLRHPMNTSSTGPPQANGSADVTEGPGPTTAWDAEHGMDWQSSEDAVAVRPVTDADVRALVGKPPASGAWREGDPVGDRRFVAHRRADDRGRRAHPGRPRLLRVLGTAWTPTAATRSSCCTPSPATPTSSARPAPASRRTAGGRASSVPGLALDTDRWFVVAPNVLGGCAGTTGPASLGPGPVGVGRPLPLRHDPRPGRRHRSRSRTRSAVDRFAAVVGGSMGGMHALEWAVGFPERVARLAVLAAPRDLERRPDRAELGADGGGPRGPAVPRRRLLRRRRRGRSVPRPSRSPAGWHS